MKTKQTKIITPIRKPRVNVVYV